MRRMLLTLWLVAWMATAADVPAATAGETPKAVVRYLASPRYILELPIGATDEHVATASSMLTTLEGLSGMLDAEFVKAGVTKEKDVPAPDKIAEFQSKGPEKLAKAPSGPPRWNVRLRVTRDEMEALCQPLQITVNTQGTAFYCNGRDAFLGVVVEKFVLADLLQWGTLQFLYHRAELQFNRLAKPRGACVPYGMMHFIRWSHLADARLPAELGGIDRKYADKLRKRIADHDPTFPSLEELFAATPPDIDADPTTLIGASVLFTEFLWESSPASRVHFIRALRTYGLSGKPVREFPLQTLVDELKPTFKSSAELETAFRAFAVERSAEVNERKSKPK